MFGRVSILIFLLATTKAAIALSASTACVMKASPRNIDTITALSCELEIKNLQCEKYFKDNGIPKEKMRTCDKSSGAIDFLESCRDGAGGFFTQMYESTVGSFKTQSELYEAEELKQRIFEKICEQDKSLSMKRSLEVSSRLEGVSRPVDDEKLKNISCKKLMQDVNARENFREFQQYVDKLDSKEFRSQWDEARKNAFLTLKEKVIAAAEKAGIVFECYNAAAKTEIGCQVATALVTGAVVKRALSPGTSVAAKEGGAIVKTEDALSKAPESALIAKAADEPVLTIPGTQYNWQLNPNDSAHVQDHVWSKGAFKDLSISDYQLRQEKFYDSLTSIADQEELLKRRNLEISQILKNADKDQKKQLGSTLTDEFKKNTASLDELKKQRMTLVNIENPYLPANATSYFTSQDLDSVIKDISKLPPSQVEHVNKAGFQSSMYRATIKKAGQETRVVIVVCEKNEGCVREGTLIPQGRPLTIYPECGPDVVKVNYGRGSLIDSLAKKDANGKVVKIPPGTFVTTVTCK